MYHRRGRLRLGDSQDVRRAEVYENLLYSCASCNMAKGTQQAPDPLATLTSGQVTVHDNGSIEGLTDEARRLIRIIDLNDDKYCVGDASGFESSIWPSSTIRHSSSSSWDFRTCCRISRRSIRQAETRDPRELGNLILSSGGEANCQRRINPPSYSFSRTAQ